MVFSDLESALAYIRMVVNQAMYEMADEIKLIMAEVTQEQVEGWTYQIFDSVISQAGGLEAMAEFVDNGSWVSLITGDEVGNPIKFLEAGTTWNRGASNIMDTSFGRAQAEIPDKLKAYLRARGIPVI